MSNTPNNGPDESREAANNSKKNDFQSIIDEYVGSKLKIDLYYFKNMGTASEIKTKLIDDFKGYLVENCNNAILKDFQEGKDEIYGYKLIKTVIQQSTIGLELLKTLEGIYQNEYGVLNPNKLNRLKSEMSKLELSYLKALIHSQVRRKKFLIDKNILSRGEADELFKDDEKDEKLLKSIFGNIPENIPEDVLETLRKFELNSRITIEDIKKLIGIIDNEEGKLSVIKYFIPNISLKILVDLGIYNRDVVRGIVKDKFLTEYGYDVDDSILNSIDYSNFFVNSSEINDLGRIFQSDNIDDFLYKIVNVYNDSAKEINKDSTTFVNLSDFCQKIKQNQNIIPSIRENIDKMQIGNYLKFSSKINGKIVTQYFYINNINQDLSVFDFLNITLKDGVSKSNRGDLEKYSFSTFFNLLESIKPNSGLDIDFFTKDEFDNSGINKVPEIDEISSKQELISFLDKIDEEGKGVSIDKMAFRCQIIDKNTGKAKKGEYEYFIVDKVDDNYVYINGQPPLKISDFASAFKERGCKRFNRIDNLQDLLVNIKGNKNLGNSFSDITIKDGKFVPKGKENEKDFPGIKYFVGANGVAIYVEKMTDNSIDFSEGEFKEEEGNSIKYKEKRKGKGMNLNFFYSYISDKNFIPKDTSNKNVEQEIEGNSKFKSKRGIFKKWFSCMSIMEIIGGGQQFIGAIKTHLETGNKLKSAKFALAMGKFLPASVRQDLKSTVWSEEKKIVDEIVTKLRGRNTGELIDEVIKLLKSSRPFDPELEAALFAIIGKFGYLYPKGLKEYKGSFMWYKALGGRVGDNVFNEYKKKCEKLNVPFTEEYLVENLLDYQTDNGYRRFKVNKDYGNVIKQGGKEELEDGENKTSNKATLDGRLDYIIGEFKNLTYFNGIGGLENLWAKGPNPGYKMNAPAFVMLASGMPLDFTEETINKVKKYALSTPHTSLYFIADKKHVALYSDYILRVLELIGGPVDEFRQISSKPDRSSKVDASYKFWKKYGEKLYPVINMHDGFVVSKMNESGNEVLKDYFNLVKNVHDSDDFKNGMNQEATEGGSIDFVNSPVAATGGLLSAKLGINGVNGDFSNKTSAKVLEMHTDYFNNIISNESLTLEERKRLYFETYQRIEREVYKKMGSLMSENSRYKEFEVYRYLFLNGIEVFPENFLDSKGNFLQNDYNSKLEKKWQEFLSGKSNNDLDNPVLQGVETTRISISDIIRDSSSNNT